MTRSVMSSRLSSRMCAALIASHFLRSKRAGFGFTRWMSKASAISSMREDVAVLGDAPAQQRQVVEDALGQEPALDVLAEAGTRVALGQPLVALAHHDRQVAEAGSPVPTPMPPSAR